MKAMTKCVLELSRCLKPSLLFLSLLLPWSSIARGQSEGPADYFTAVEKLPSQVVAEITAGLPEPNMQQMLYGFVGMPMSEAHRREFINGLRAASGPSARTAFRCALDLLEADGRYEEALALLQDSRPSEDKVRLTGLLWKLGKKAEAAMMADQSPTSYLPEDWLAIVAIDLIKDRHETAMKLLEFLEERPRFSANVRHALAIQHLEIARRLGKSTQLVDQSESKVLQAVWNSALGRREKAMELVTNLASGLEVRDVQLLLLAVGNEPPLLARTKVLLGLRETSAEERRGLLSRFPLQPLGAKLWCEMVGGHGESADLMETLTPNSSKESAAAVREKCLELLKKGPADPHLQLLAARLSSQEADEGRLLFTAASRSMIKRPEAGTPHSDPALKAIEILAKKLGPAELQKLLLEAPGFHQLQAGDQLRYLMAADLDLQVVEVLNKGKFDPTTQGKLDWDLEAYFKRRAAGHLIPEEVVMTLWKRLAELLLEDPAMPDSLLEARVGTWVGLLGTMKVQKAAQAELLNRLVAAAGRPGAERQQLVLMAMPSFVWSIPGIDFKRPTAIKTPGFLPLRPLLDCVSIFCPPDYRKIGQEFDASQPPEMLRQFPDAAGIDYSYLVLRNSRWRINLRHVKTPGWLNAVLMARLRKLHDASPSQTLFYDLLIANGELECPDPGLIEAATRRIQGSVPDFQGDPAVQVYLYLKRLRKGDPPEAASAALEGVENSTTMARQALISDLGLKSRFYKLKPDALDLVLRKLGYVAPVESVHAPEPPSPYDRLQFFREAGRENSPECIELARKTLFDFADSKQAMTGSAENISVSVLVETAQFGAFLEDLKTRKTATGASELEVQRALYRAHTYRIVHSHGEIEPYARRILELDPNDFGATLTVVVSALREKDHKLALRCLELICRQSRQEFLFALDGTEHGDQSHTHANVLSIFTGTHAGELVDALLAIPYPPVDSIYVDRDRVAAALFHFYRHVADHAPDRLRAVIQWSNGFEIANRPTLFALADYLDKVRHSPDVISILAAAFFSQPSSDPDELYRFKLRNPQILPASDALSLARLNQNAWLKPLIEASANYPSSPWTDGIRLLLELGANPTIEAWERLGPPFVASLPVADRVQIGRRIAELLVGVTGSEALRNHLIKQDAQPADQRATLDGCFHAIEAAAIAGEATEIPKLWNSALPFLSQSADGPRNYYLCRIAMALAPVADEAVWKECIEWCAKTKGFPDSWILTYGGSELEKISDARVADLCKVIMTGSVASHGPFEEPCLRLFDRLASSSFPDPETMELFRAWIQLGMNTEDNSTASEARLQFLDLIKGSLEACSPQIMATPGSHSKWSIDWTLAAFKNKQASFPFAGKSGFFDGKFDLEILGGPTPERLSHLASVESAAGCGHVELPLPDGTKYLALLAKERGGASVRWSRPVEIEFNMAGKIDPILDKDYGSFTRAQSSGPFMREDSVEVELNAGVGIDLAEIPWTGGPPPKVSGWLLKLSLRGDLMLSFRTRDGVEIGKQNIANHDGGLGKMPFWQQFKSQENAQIPAETDKIVLAFRPFSKDAKSKFRISGLRYALLSPALYPQGFSSIARIPASPDRVVMDTQANRFAFWSDRLGFGVFDLSSNQFLGWIPLHPRVPQEPELMPWFALAGDRLLCIGSDGAVTLFSISSRVGKSLGKVRMLETRWNDDVPFVLSPNGEFLASHGTMAGTQIWKITEEKLLARPLVETPQVEHIRFTEDSSTLEVFADSNLYSMDLGKWDQSEAKVSKASFSQTAEKLAMSGKYLARETLVDPFHELTFQVSSDADMTVRMFAKTRTIILPEGVVAMDREKRPFFVSVTGVVYRIDPSKLPGLESPPKK